MSIEFIFALSALKTATVANDRISNLPLPMVFKGTLGTGGTIESLPTAIHENEGYTYLVITDGTYAEQSAIAGDTFISDGESWVLVPAGDNQYALSLLTDVDLTNPQDGQTLKYNATSGKWENGTSSASYITLSSTLPAGSTTITFTDSAIVDNKAYFVGTSVFGVMPTNVEVTLNTHTLTATFTAQQDAIGVEVIII